MLADFGVGQVFWSLIWLVIFVLWIILSFFVLADVFRSHDLSGVAKALWVVFVVFVPFIGVFVYLVLRGGSTAERRV